jgi:hypothetical protein
MKLSGRVAAGAKPAQVRYALASETGFDDGQAPVAARGAGVGVVDAPAATVFEFDGALPHLLVDLEVDLLPPAVAGAASNWVLGLPSGSASNFLNLPSKSTPSVNVGGW